METNTFDELLQGVKTENGSISAIIPEDWIQGRSAFGGLAAALALRALRPQVQDGRRLRSLLVSFVGPVEVGTVAIGVETLRSGRAVTHLQARMVQRGTVRCVVLGSFGADRISGLVVPPQPRPPAPGPDNLTDLPFVPGMTPAFTQHFAYRGTAGAMPYSGASTSELGGWCRFRDAGSALTEEWILALVDAWPSPVLAMLQGPAPASSLTWSIDIVNLAADAAADDWWFYRSSADSAANGYVQFGAFLWDSKGRLVALSRQTSVVFA